MSNRLLTVPADAQLVVAEMTNYLNMYVAFFSIAGLVVAGQEP